VRLGDHPLSRRCCERKSEAGVNSVVLRYQALKTTADADKPPAPCSHPRSPGHQVRSSSVHSLCQLGFGILIATVTAIASVRIKRRDNV
jgi:hypothetical protein